MTIMIHATAHPERRPLFIISITSCGTTTPEIESKLGIKLPPSAVVKFVERDGFLDEYINFKFEINRSDLAPLLENSPFAGIEMSSMDQTVSQYGS